MATVDLMRSLLPPTSKQFISAEDEAVAPCTYCTSEAAIGNSFFPYHYASGACQSGMRNHCTCDTCY
jgi:hypothetical protein